MNIHCQQSTSHLIITALITTQLLFLSPLPATARTTLSGVITEATLTPAGNPFIIDGDVIVPPGGKIEIAAGCLIIFEQYAGMTIHGSLIISGTPEMPVVLTTVNDTLNSPQIPNPYDWNGISIGSDAREVSLSYFTLRNSVYGLNSQTSQFRIFNGIFQKNAQSNIMIKGKILREVIENVPFTRDLNKVIYNANGADAGSAPVDTQLYPDSAIVTVADGIGISRKGYRFAGWGWTTDGSNAQYSPGSNFVMSNYNVELYAVWTKGSIRDTLVRPKLPKIPVPILLCISGAAFGTIAGINGKQWKTNDALVAVTPKENSKSYEQRRAASAAITLASGTLSLTGLVSGAILFTTDYLKHQGRMKTSSRWRELKVTSDGISIVFNIPDGKSNGTVVAKSPAISKHDPN